jgi:hypothetical protein
MPTEIRCSRAGGKSLRGSRGRTRVETFHAQSDRILGGGSDIWPSRSFLRMLRQMSSLSQKRRPQAGKSAEPLIKRELREFDLRPWELREGRMMITGQARQCGKPACPLKIVSKPGGPKRTVRGERVLQELENLLPRLAALVRGVEPDQEQVTDGLGLALSKIPPVQFSFRRPWRQPRVDQR